MRNVMDEAIKLLMEIYEQPKQRNFPPLLNYKFRNMLYDRINHIRMVRLDYNDGVSFDLGPDENLDLILRDKDEVNMRVQILNKGGNLGLVWSLDGKRHERKDLRREVRIEDLLLKVSKTAGGGRIDNIGKNTFFIGLNNPAPKSNPAMKGTRY